MNYPCDNCAQSLSCIFDFSFPACRKLEKWALEPLNAEAKAEEQQPHINEEWAERIMQRFERVN